MNFKTLRYKQKLTVQQVADVVGVKETTIRKYECSARIPTNQNLIKLGIALKCTDQELITAYCYHKNKNLKKIKGVE